MRPRPTVLAHESRRVAPPRARWGVIGCASEGRLDLAWLAGVLAWLAGVLAWLHPENRGLATSERLDLTPESISNPAETHSFLRAGSGLPVGLGERRPPPS